MTELRFNGCRANAAVYILITLWSVLVFTTGCSHKVDPQPPPKTYCQQFVDFLSAMGFEHDWVDVPEDYENPKSPMLRIFYYRQKNLPGVPVVTFNGGPSHSSHGMVQLIKDHQSQRSDRAQIPFVYIDQRGTGCSTNYPVVVEPEDYTRLTNYSSKNIVRDAEKVRQKLLGDKKWKIFGQSYGGQIVHRYLMTFPQSIESAHVHGGAAGIYGKEYIYRRIKSQYRVMDEYLRRFPEDKEVLIALGKDLGEMNCYDYKVSASTITEFCGPMILHRLVSMLGFSDGWTALHLWLADFLTPSGELNQSAIQDFVNRDLGPGTVQDELAWNSTPARIINYLDFADGGFTLKVCQEVDARLEAEALIRKPWHIDECRAILNSTISEEEMASEQSLEKYLNSLEPELISLENLRDVIDQNGLSGKVFLYSGEMDTFVPRELFAEQLSVLGDRVKYHHFQSSGHEGFLEPLVWKNLRQ